MRIGLLMLLDALLISASLLMGLQVYYDMHCPGSCISSTSGAACRC